MICNVLLQIDMLKQATIISSFVRTTVMKPEYGRRLGLLNYLIISLLEKTKREGRKPNVFPSALSLQHCGPMKLM